MKKINIIGCLILLLGCFSHSCTDEGYKEGNSVVYIATTPFMDLDVYDISETFTYNFGIYRSGFGTLADAQIGLQTEAELNDYNAINATDYRLLPSSCYEFVNTQVSFGGNIEDTNRYVEIKFSLPALKELYASANDVEYALPVKITESSIGINEEKASTLIIPMIKEPLFSMVFNTLQQYNFELGKIPATISVDVPIEVGFNNQWDVTCTLDNPEEALEEYNQENDKSFQMIADGYTLDRSVTMQAGTKRVVSKLVVETGKLNIGSHGLPIRLAEVSDSRFGVNPDKDLFIVGVDIIVPLLDRTGWTAESTSDHEGWGKGVNAILDDNKETIWHSNEDFTNAGEPKIPVEIVIDMKQEYNVMQIDLMQRQDGGNYDTHKGVFYVSSDNVTWQKVGEFEMGKVKEAQMFKVEPTKCRYVKIDITRAYRHVAGLAEVYIRGLSD